MRRFSNVLLLLPFSAFALDEKPLLSEQSMEGGLVTGFAGTFMVLDDAGQFQDATVPSLPTSWTFAGTFKYGMSESSDLEIVFPWIYRDKDWAELQGRERSGLMGFDRLSLSSKISLFKRPFGLLVGFDVPMGHAKIVGFDPEWGFKGGLWGGYRRGAAWVDGLGIWGVTPENQNKFKPGDRQTILANAGYQFEGGVAPQFGVTWSREGKTSVNGKETGVSAWSLQLEPGAVLELDEDWRLDVKVPTVVAGANRFATTGLQIHLIGNFEP